MGKELQRYSVRIKGLTHTASNKKDLMALKKRMKSDAEIKKLKRPYMA